MSIEDDFVTTDVGTTFKMIEDEGGDVFWGYGHRDGPEFIEEINRWLIHACGATTPDDLFASNQPIEYLWARYAKEGDERFETTQHRGDDDWINSDVFPVTRLVI